MHDEEEAGMCPADATHVSQLRRGALELAILALLSDGELYGVEIVDRLRAIPGLEAGPGTVYPLLSRLSKAGEVSAAWRESPMGPPRKYYRLSSAGRRTLEELAALWRGMSSAIDTLIAGVSSDA